MSLTKDNIKEIVFSNYTVLCSFAKLKFGYIENYGLSPDELVNEAIITIFDSTAEFFDEVELLRFIEKSITTIGYEEKEHLKDGNFLDRRKSSGEGYSLLDKEIKEVVAPSEDFLRIYSFFELARFGIDKEKMICPKCRNNSFYLRKEVLKSGSGKYKCKLCGHNMSLHSTTYINNLKLPFLKLYKLVSILSKYPKISSCELSRRVGITQATAWKRKHLFSSAAETINSYNKADIMDKILSCIYHDSGIEMIEKNKRKFSDDDIRMIRKMRNELQMTCKEIASCYITDASTINKIAKGKIYANV